MRSHLKDEQGNIVPYHEFEQKVLKLNEDYNQNYLEAEYEFATQSAMNAASWNNLQEDTNRYWLEYRTAGDNRVRAEHDALRGICLPKTDPFWQNYYPPNGWRCRCVAVEVLVEDYELSDSDKAQQLGERATTYIGKSGKNKYEMFRFNPGVEKKIFPKNHPYTKVEGSDKAKKAIEQMEHDQKVFDYFGGIEKYKSEKIFNDILEHASAFNLREAQTLSIFQYTIDFYQEANTYLRNGFAPEDKKYYENRGIKSIIEVLNQGLDKLPSYQGTVFRGADLSSEQIETYKKALESNTPVVKNEFLSSSRERKTAFNKNTVYRILSKTGKSIEKMSYFENEKEVLFKAGTKFKVVKIDDLGGQYSVELEEL